MTSSGVLSMMMASNGNIFHVTGPLCREFTGPRWIPCTKASDTEPWCLISAWINGWVNNCEAGDLRHHRTHHDVTVMVCHTWCNTISTNQNAQGWECIKCSLSIALFQINLWNYVMFKNKCFCPNLIWKYIDGLAQDCSNSILLTHWSYCNLAVSIDIMVIKLQQKNGMIFLKQRFFFNQHIFRK